MVSSTRFEHHGFIRNIGKELHSTCVGCIQRGGQGWSGYEISHMLCRKDGVGTWVLLYFILG